MSLQWIVKYIHLELTEQIMTNVDKNVCYHSIYTLDLKKTKEEIPFYEIVIYINQQNIMFKI